MEKKRVYIICLIVSLLTLLFFFFNVNKKENIDENIKITTQLVSKNVEKGQDVIVDIEVKNNSDKSIYNVEILTESPNKDYVRSHGNKICNNAEEITPGDSLYLRSVYKEKDEEYNGDTFKGYEIKRVNKILIVICFIFYLFLVALILKYLVKDNSKLNIFYVCLIFILSIFLCLLLRNIISKCRDVSIINSYKNVVEVDIDGRTEKVKILVNYTLDNLENIIDKNHNNMPDVAEKNDLTTDTDGDGLPDYYELYLCGTNPLMLDSKSIGLSDINYDTDLDGVCNLQEFKLGLNPLNKDTDYDGLDDNKELKLKTDPLNWDTDSDGMSDGFEIEQGYDPLKADMEVEVSKELISESKSADNIIKAGVKINTNAKIAESLNIETYETILVNEDMPGYIGSAFNFILDGEFSSGEISFEIANRWFSRSEYDPCIYYFDEDTQLLEELETNIDGNILSAKVEHFSVYVVLNRTEVSKWLYEDIFYQDLDNGVKKVNISFVLDNSQSMDSIDKEHRASKIINNFIDKLDNDLCYISLTTFTAKAQILSRFTKDYNNIKNIVNNIVRDDGYNEYSGTDIQRGILKSIGISNGIGMNDTYNILILVTDGDDTRKDINVDSLINKLSNHYTRMFCIDVGLIEDNVLKNISVRSGGNYYLVGDIEGEVFEKTLSDIRTVIESVENPDRDIVGGLTVLDRQFIKANVLKTGTGLQIFKKDNINLSLLDTQEDIDDDGLLNGDEIKVEFLDGHTYLKIYSNPFEKDTDNDGIEDGEDTAPFMFGMKGGIIGELYIGAEPTHPNINPFEFYPGHAWIVLHSYVNKSLEDYVAIKSGFEPISYNNILLYLPRNNLYPYSLKAKSYTSFGYTTGKQGDSWPSDLSDEEVAQRVIDFMNGKEGAFVEEKITSDFVLNEEFSNVYDRGEGRDFYKQAYGYGQLITYNDLYNLLNYMNVDRLYTLVTYNCTDFAVESWNHAISNYEEKIDYNTHRFLSLPTSLHNILSNKENVDKNFDDTMREWTNDVSLYGCVREIISKGE